MKQQQTNKHSNLHREDQHITVEELWRGWKTSEGGSKGLSHPLWTHSRVACLMFCFFSSSSSSSCIHPVHNWTVEDTVQWLKDSVELPQYEKNFRDFRVTGNTLPRSGLTSSLFQRFHLASSAAIIKPMLPSAGQQWNDSTDFIYSEKNQIFQSVNTLYVEFYSNFVFRLS